ncbi:MAG TPA: cell division protein FtsA [Candidatus Saccharimonadales bacterium]|nr:cell division protein FtsA [Candidatus Saccharimonadales bacterium]
MPKDTLLVGLDIGTSKVAIAVGAVSEQSIHIVGLSAISHSGLRKGVITDIEETVSAISHTLEDAERMAGTSITHAYVATSGAQIEAIPAKGVVAISKPNGEIDHSDVARVIDAARTATLPQNRELIHLFPLRFLVDGQDVSREPTGMNGIRLETDALIISTSAIATRNLQKSVYQAGLEIDGLVFGPIAAAKLITTKQQRESGVAVVDFGAGSTDLAIFEEGQLIHAASIPAGSMHITNDIAIGLRTNLDVAEAIKTRYGTAMIDKVRESESINLSTLDPAESDKVSRKHIAEIIEARVSEIFQLIKEELRSVGKDGLLPAGLIFTGGGSDLEGITELARQQLRLPATIGYPTTAFSGVVDKTDNPIYATSIGLVLWALEESGGQTAPWRLDFGKIGGVFDRFRGIFRSFTN